MADISIITPSFNMIEYLKLCSASVADQNGVSFEHIIVDNTSTDGTIEYLKSQSNVHWISEPDNGMYDAVNKGLKMATGEILAYLNCDEQYLPGTLKNVVDYFNQHPDIDVIFGDFYLVDPFGALIAFRKGQKLRYRYLFASHLYMWTCTMFFRKRIIDDGMKFNIKYKSIADLEFVLNLLKNKYSIKYYKSYLSVFTWTGNNMSFSSESQREREILYHDIPIDVRYFKYLYKALRLIEKYYSGAYIETSPITYAIYTKESLQERKQFISQKVSYKWPKY